MSSAPTVAQRPTRPTRGSRVAIVTTALVVAVLAATYASVAFGSSRLAGEQVWQALRGQSTDAHAAVVLGLRVPRTVVGLLCGAALGLALVENGWRVLFIRTTDLVQRLQAARRDLQLEAAIAKLDKYHLLILDDLAYVSKDQAETSVLFELIAARYERRSLLITANQPFGEWSKVFPDQAMTLAAVDRLVHHATIFEMNVESYRRRTALARKRGPGRPPSRATIKTAS